jgi:hypothetical protein
LPREAGKTTSRQALGIHNEHAAIVFDLHASASGHIDRINKL